MGGDLLAFFGLESAGKEEFEFKQSDGSLHILVRDGPAYGCFMKSQFIRRLPHCHGLERFCSVFHEVVLCGDDQFRDAADCVFPLVDVVDQQPSVRNLGTDVGLVFRRNVRILQHLQITFGNGEPSAEGIVLNDAEGVSVLFDGDFRHNIERRGRGNGIARMGIQLPELSGQLVEPVHGDVHFSGDQRQTVVRQVVQMVPDEPGKFGILRGGLLELKQQTFLEIACRDAGRIEALHQGKRPFGSFCRTVDRLRDFRRRRCQISGFVKTADDVFRCRSGFFRNVGEAELIEQVFLK